MSLFQKKMVYRSSPSNWYSSHNACHFITLILTLKPDLGSSIDFSVSQVNQLGPLGGPILFCIVASLYCGISPMGYLPTLLSGITFEWYIAPILSYVSVNIGSCINMLFVRNIVLRYQCCQCLFKCMLGEKMGKISYLEHALVLQPIKIVMLARFPYVSNGLFNYLFSLSSIPMKYYIIGNAIGFIPGSIMFSIFGTQLRSLATIITDGVGSVKQFTLFIIVCVITCISYGILVWKVRKLLKSTAATANHAQEQQEEEVRSESQSANVNINVGGGHDDDQESEQSLQRQPFVHQDTSVLDRL